jgi:hypothetical protein
MVILRPLADYKAKTRLKSFKQISMLIITLCKETIALFASCAGQPNRGQGQTIG